MEFMILIVGRSDREASPQEMGEMMGRMGQWAQTLAARGRMRGGSPLKSVTEAATGLEA